MSTKHKAKRTPEKLIVTSIRLDSDTHERFKAHAARERRSVSQQLRRLIEKELAETGGAA